MSEGSYRFGVALVLIAGEAVAALGFYHGSGVEVAAGFAVIGLSFCLDAVID